jgi:hypothetical protein
MAATLVWYSEILPPSGIVSSITEEMTLFSTEESLMLPIFPISSSHNSPFLYIYVKQVALTVAPPPAA